MKTEKIVGRGFTRRKKAFVLMLAVIGGLAALLYFEQVALIYVLATFGLVVLLLIVAFADLEKIGQASEQAAEAPASENKEKTRTAQKRVAVEKKRREAV